MAADDYVISLTIAGFPAYDFFVEVREGYPIISALTAQTDQPKP